MIKQAIYTLLKNDAAVAALVVARIYPSHLPQNCTLPAISFTRISGAEQTTHSGPNGFAEQVFQIDCWAETPLAAETLGAAVSDLLNGYTGTVGTTQITNVELLNTTDMDDVAIGDYRTSLDFSFEFSES